MHYVFLPITDVYSSQKEGMFLFSFNSLGHTSITTRSKPGTGRNSPLFTNTVVPRNLLVAEEPYAALLNASYP